MCSGLILCLICYVMHLRLSILAWLSASVDQVKLFLFSFFLFPFIHFLYAMYLSLCVFFSVVSSMVSFQ